MSHASRDPNLTRMRLVGLKPEMEQRVQEACEHCGVACADAADNVDIEWRSPDAESPPRGWAIIQIGAKGASQTAPVVSSRDLATADVDAVLSDDASLDEIQTAAQLCVKIALLRQELATSREEAARFLDQAHNDPLTGLANRRGWEKALDQLRNSLQRFPRPLTVVVLDVDFFKQCNDSQGHAFGDTILQAIGEALRNHLRHADIVARMGGDEFVIVTLGVDSQVAATVVERIRKHVQSALQAAFPEHAPTLSAGAAVADAPEDLDLLLQLADAQLREAKCAGRNRSCVAFSRDAL